MPKLKITFPSGKTIEGKLNEEDKIVDKIGKLMIEQISNSIRIDAFDFYHNDKFFDVDQTFKESGLSGDIKINAYLPKAAHVELPNGKYITAPFRDHDKISVIKDWLSDKAKDIGQEMELTKEDIKKLNLYYNNEILRDEETFEESGIKTTKRDGRNIAKIKASYNIDIQVEGHNSKEVITLNINLDNI